MVLYKLSLHKYLDNLASRTPAPGGGSASALVSALGVSLFVMCLEYSSKNFTPREFKSLRRKLEGIKEELIKLIDEDKNAYLELARAYKENVGDKKLNSVRKKAGEVPSEVCEFCLEVLRIMVASRDKIKKIFLSDFSASLKFLTAGLESARIFVTINCKGIKSLERRLNSIDQEYKKIRKELTKWQQK